MWGKMWLNFKGGVERCIRYHERANHDMISNGFCAQYEFRHNFQFSMVNEDSEIFQEDILRAVR